LFNGATPLIAARAAVRLAAVATRVVGSVAEEAAAGSAKTFSQIFAGTAEPSGDTARPAFDRSSLEPLGDDAVGAGPAVGGHAVGGHAVGGHAVGDPGGPEPTPRERFERGILDLLRSVGIDISRPIHIDVTSTGEIAVTDANRQASAIETTLRASDAWGGLVADFFESDATAAYPRGRISVVVGGPE
jgi:hypothetical protein